jgi:DNA-binding XRE family transcriptional regulator
MMRNNLVNRRKEMGLKQTALARLAGIHPSSMCDLERGRTGGSVSVWDRLEELLGVPQQVLRRLDSPGNGPERRAR